MIVPLQWETTGGETLPEAGRKAQALPHPLLGGWGASATLRYTKEMGSLPETHLTPQEGKPGETGGSGPPPRSPRQQDETWVGREQAAWRSPAAPPGSLGRAPGVQLVFPGSPGNSCVLPSPSPPSEGREKALPCGREAQPHPTLPGPEDGRKRPKSAPGLRADGCAGCVPHLTGAPDPSCIPPMPAF